MTRGTGFVMDAAPAGDATAWLQYRHWVPTDMSGNLALSNILDFYGYNSGGAMPMSGTAVCTELGLHTSVTARDSKSVVVIRMRAYNNEIRFDLTAKGSQAPTQIWINGQLAAQAADGCLPVGKAVERPGRQRRPEGHAGGRRPPAGPGGLGRLGRHGRRRRHLRAPPLDPRGASASTTSRPTATPNAWPPRLTSAPAADRSNWRTFASTATCTT